MDETVAMEARQLTTQVAEFRAEVRRRNLWIVALLMVGIFAMGLNIFSSLQARSASQGNGELLKFVNQAMDPRTQLGHDALCRNLVLHGLDGPACDEQRRKLESQGALLGP